MAFAILAGLILVFGLLLAGGGAWLLSLGGSAYYAIAGALLVVSALLLFARRPAALWLYAMVVGGTLAWALFEVGFDWWQLAPRGGVLVVVGVLLLLPFVTRPLRRRSGRTGAAPLALVLVLYLATAIASLLIPDRYNLDGALPVAALAGPAQVPVADGD